MSAASLTASQIRARAAARPAGTIGLIGLAAVGLLFSVGLIVYATPIGGGDYGQWLMVSRHFAGATTPEYRDLAHVAPLVPAAIALAYAVLGNADAALRLVGFALVVGLGAAFFAAGWTFTGRRSAGLVAGAIALLVTDQFLNLLAFGGLPQGFAIAFLVFALAAFARAVAVPAQERAWWALGCLALFVACMTHVPTATLAVPACVAAAALGLQPRPGEPFVARARAMIPLGLAFVAVGAYWLIAVLPQSAGLVTNPASLSYRGPGRLVDILVGYGPTLAIIAVGAIAMVAWLVEVLVRRAVPRRGDPRVVLFVWVLAAWGSFGWSAFARASTDYPRFAPILVGPFVVATAAAVTMGTASVARRVRVRATEGRTVAAVALGVLLVAPFSFAKYATAAKGYELPDATAVSSVAAWCDARLLPGVSILAPVREAKWIEGLTGRSALFTSDVRYAFRTVEWERSLAAAAILRGNLALANESFVLTLTDGVAAPFGQEPRGLLIAANHGGEFVDLLRVVPGGSAILRGPGFRDGSFEALVPTGFTHARLGDTLTATTTWASAGSQSAPALVSTLRLDSGSTTFGLDAQADAGTATSRIQLMVRPATGVALLEIVPGPSTSSVELAFSSMGNAQPRLRLTVEDGGTIASSASGGLVVTSAGPRLALDVTDLTAGGASTSLRLLDPSELIRQYDVGAILLRRDASYESRRARLELLGFHVAEADGQYVVMASSDAVRPAGAR